MLTEYNILGRGARASSKAVRNLVLSMLPTGIIEANSTYGHHDPPSDELKKLRSSATSRGQQGNTNKDQGSAATDDLLPTEAVTSSSRSPDSIVDETETGKRLYRSSILIGDDEVDGSEIPRAKRQRVAIRNQHSGNVFSGDPDPIYSDGRAYNQDCNLSYADAATDQALIDIFGDPLSLSLANQIPTGSRTSRFPQVAESQKGQQQVPLQVLGSCHEGRVTDHRSDNIGISGLGYHNSSGLNPVHDPSSNPRIAIRTGSQGRINEQAPQSSGGLGSFDINDFDLYPEEEGYPLSRFSDLGSAVPDHPQELQQADSTNKSMLSSGVSEINLEVGKTYIVVCLNSAVATKCHVAAHDSLVSDRLGLQVLLQEIDKLKRNPLSWRSKAISRESPDDSNLEPNYSVVQLPIHKQYIIICFEDRSYHMGITAEADETIWGEIGYTQLVEDALALEEQS